MADERDEHNDEGFKGKFGFTGFRTNADKFYRSPSAPMSPNNPQPGTIAHYAIRAESTYIKGMCACGHYWEANSPGIRPYCSSNFTTGMWESYIIAKHCPACPVCNGSVKSPQRNIPSQPHRPVDEIKTPDRQIHYLLLEGVCACYHYWTTTGICKYDLAGPHGLRKECPTCPVCNARRQPERKPIGPTGETVFWLRDPDAVRLPFTTSQYTPSTKIPTPAPPVSGLLIATITASSVLGGFFLGLALGMWIGGLH